MSMQRNKAISAIKSLKATARWQLATDAALAGLLTDADRQESLEHAITTEELRARLSDTGSHGLGAPYGGKTGFAKDLLVVKGIVFGNWVNILLVCLPLGFMSEYMGWGATATFTLNFFALIPLALILGDITEDLALRFGDVIGGLLNATFGNVVEIILSIAALTKGLYTVVAASLIGSILSNLLLVLGCCMLFGGVNFKTQTFNAVSNRACSSLLFLAVIGVVMPTAAFNLVHDDAEGRSEDWILDISRISAVVLLFMYVCYLVFQLVTHKDLFNESGGDDEAEQAQLSTLTSLLMLGIITVLVSFSSEFLTGSIEEVSKTTGLREAFLGMIVLPIAGNACEHITAVIVAMKNKMDLALGVAMGSSLQIALFALPLCIVVGWATGHPFSLNLDPFMAVVLTLSVVYCNIITNDAASHWLQGSQLVAVYFIIAVAYYYR